jgi:hypothetical protein
MGTIALASWSHFVNTSTAIPIRLVSSDKTVSSNFSTYDFARALVVTLQLGHI